MPTVSPAHRLLVALLLLALTLVAAQSLLAQELPEPVSSATLAGPALSGLNPPKPGSPGLGSTALATPDFLPVEEAYVLAVEQLDEQTLLAVWQMPPGYYLYQHAFAFELSDGSESTTLEPVFPSALTHEDEYFGRVQVYYDQAEVRLRADRAIETGLLKVTSQGCADAGLCYPPRTQLFRISAQGISETTPPRRKTEPAKTTAGMGTGLLLMLLLAFAGGVILNLMPCVLPVLSLKVIGFTHAPAQERRAHGWLYSAGVISSFIVVAGLLLALRSAGQALGWGFQLQSPGFVISLGYLFVVLGLALSGVVELGNRFMNLGSELAGRGGHSGSFFTGVLAVIVASPCTAPFMGTALGYALVQPPLPALLVFAALGVGMAAPMLLLSYSNAAQRLLPGPGLWMERLKQALAFPLYATALWLFWVAGRQAGVDVMAATLLGALAISFALWLWRDRLWAKTIAILCIAAAIALGSWRPENTTSTAPVDTAGRVPFSTAALEQRLMAGERVFVDVTADWCITCLANERAVLNTDPVQAAFKQAGVTYMVADWTDYDADIAAFVANHGRSGIPLYVLYDGAGGVEILPQLLRKATVLGALDALGTDDLAR